MRTCNRQLNELRHVEMILGYTKYAEGSCLIKLGNTVVLCNASIDNKVPHFLKNTGKGWITAEYGMLPRSTNSRMQREASKGKQDGRTQEIQRLIGRSLRSAVDLTTIAEHQIIIDCDVIQADGGTRTAAITAGYVALYEALRNLVRNGMLKKMPITSHIAAVSCGMVKGKPMLDLEYSEDSVAEADANFVLDDKKNIIEVQATAENKPFSIKEFNSMLELANCGIETLLIMQKETLKI